MTALNNLKSKASRLFIIPAKQHVSAFSDAPQTAHRRYHPIVRRIIDGVTLRERLSSPHADSTSISASHHFMLIAV